MAFLRTFRGMPKQNYYSRPLVCVTISCPSKWIISNSNVWGLLNMIGHTESEKLKGRDRMTNIHKVFSFFLFFPTKCFHLHYFMYHLTGYAKQVVLVPFGRQGNWGPEKVSDSPKLIKVLSRRTGIQISCYWRNGDLNYWQKQLIPLQLLI